MFQNSNQSSSPLLPSKCAQLLHNAADLLTQMKPGADTGPIIAAALEAREQLERIVAGIEVMEREPQQPRLRRA